VVAVYHYQHGYDDGMLATQVETQNDDGDYDSRQFHDVGYDDDVGPLTQALPSTQPETQEETEEEEEGGWATPRETTPLKRSTPPQLPGATKGLRHGWSYWTGSQVA